MQQANKHKHQTFSQWLTHGRISCLDSQ